MAVFVKPPDVSFPAELLWESDLLYGDHPVLGTLGVLALIRKHIWEW